MAKDPTWELVREIRDMNRTIEKGFREMNKTLDNGFKAMNKMLKSNIWTKNNEDYWHPVTGADGGLPGLEYTWVLVKIMENRSGDVNLTPHIARAEVTNDEKVVWHMLERSMTYEDIDYTVMFWRPLPM